MFYHLMREESARVTTILFSSHLMEHVTQLCTHAAIIRSGRLVMAAGIENLRRSLGGWHTLEEVFLHHTRDSEALLT